jgi:hypothetical protein
MKKGEKKQLCLRGHDISIMGRYGNGGNCIQCAIDFRTNNKELIKKRKHLDWEKNKEKRKKKHLEWLEKNQDKVREYSKEYRKAHVVEHRIGNLKNKTNRNLRIPFFGQEGILEFYQACPKNKVVDHYIPLCGRKVSGLHVSWNLQYLTPKQNRSKHNKANLKEISKWYGKLLKKAGLK